MVGLFLVGTLAHGQGPPPMRPKAATVVHREWIQIPLDTFILAQCEAAGREPPAELPSAVLLDRLTQTLLGRRATAAEIAAFVRSRDKRAYEKQVDRLLAAPECADRFASLAKLMRKDDPASARRAADACWRMALGRPLENAAALEWLACEVIDPTLVNCCELDRIPESWDVKHLLRAVVVSAAYRTQSATSAKSD